MLILPNFQHSKEFYNWLLKPCFSPGNLNHLPEVSKLKSLISELHSTVNGTKLFLAESDSGRLTDRLVRLV